MAVGSWAIKARDVIWEEEFRDLWRNDRYIGEGESIFPQNHLTSFMDEPILKIYEAWILKAGIQIGLWTYLRVSEWVSEWVVS